jgi:hypothetical protein
VSIARSSTSGYCALDWAGMVAVGVAHCYGMCSVSLHGFVMGYFYFVHEIRHGIAPPPCRCALDVMLHLLLPVETAGSVRDALSRCCW